MALTKGEAAKIARKPIVSPKIPGILYTVFATRLMSPINPATIPGASGQRKMNEWIEWRNEEVYPHSRSHHAACFVFVAIAPTPLNFDMATCIPVSPFNTDILSFHTAMSSSCQVLLQLLIVIADVTMHTTSPKKLSTQSSALEVIL